MAQAAPQPDDESSAAKALRQVVSEMRALGVLKLRMHADGALEEVILGPLPAPVDAEVREDKPKRELSPVELQRARETAAEEQRQRIVGPLGGFRG